MYALCCCGNHYFFIPVCPATKNRTLKEDWIAYICREVLRVSEKHIVSAVVILIVSFCIQHCIAIITVYVKSSIGYCIWLYKLSFTRFYVILRLWVIPN